MNSKIKKREKRSKDIFLKILFVLNNLMKLLKKRKLCPLNSKVNQWTQRGKNLLKSRQEFSKTKKISLWNRPEDFHGCSSRKNSETVKISWRGAIMQKKELTDIYVFLFSEKKLKKTYQVLNKKMLFLVCVSKAKLNQ